MSTESQTAVLRQIIESLDIPDSAYEEAERRYKDFAHWLQNDPKSRSAQFEPSIGPQGSFRLGTVIRPWKREDYDLDLTFRLKKGITTQTVTQAGLKQMVGEDLNDYRTARRIQEQPEEKHRCWRLLYQDHLQFHIDTVPCIPHSDRVRAILRQRIVESGASPFLAEELARFAVAITDDRHQSYRHISDDWYISNPEGYARWFESRMKLAEALLLERTLQARAKDISDLPTFQWKTPLQRVVQILKRHRDVMYEKDPDRKPSSIIITTLAAAAYQGEQDLPNAISHILNHMEVRPALPRVPNPVNPQEDFTDKWRSADGQRMRLEENFLAWAGQAKKDIATILALPGQSQAREVLHERFAIQTADTDKHKRPDHPEHPRHPEHPPKPPHPPGPTSPPRPPDHRPVGRK
jgi:hypothetical protein